MPTTTVRISEQTHRCLARLAKQEGLSMQAVLEKALDMYRRRQFLQELNRAYANLKGDAEAWQDVQRERDTWDATLGDGLEETAIEDEVKNTSKTSIGNSAS